MKNLNDELDVLRELGKHRERAKELRKQGVRPLRTIKDIDRKKITSLKIEYGGKRETTFDFKSWVSSGNMVEIALLAKIQNHRDICDHDDENNTAHASVFLKKKLSNIRLDVDLMPADEDEPPNIDETRSVAVITAARSMQILSSRSETTLSRASMICHYRILRELYVAAPPDWTVGAARAGTGGKTSAFVTGECVRALFNFRDTIQRTAIFFRETNRLLERYENLQKMIHGIDSKGKRNHPVRLWADKTMEAMWLDWFLTTNQRKGQIALFFNNKDSNRARKDKTHDLYTYVSNNASNDLFQFPETIKKLKKVAVGDVGEYFKTCLSVLRKSIVRAKNQIDYAKKEIDMFRLREKKEYEDINPSRKPNEYHDKKWRYERTISAHIFARDRVEDISTQLEYSLRIIDEEIKKREGNVYQGKFDYLKQIFEKMEKLCEKNALGLNRNVAPTKQYIKGVIRRELSNSESLFDPGELVFAACTYGAMTSWKQHELLRRACELLVKSLPESGRFLTKRPLHTSIRGYRLLPIGCEMTRSLAFLLDKMNFEFDEVFVGRMLNIFEEKLIYLFRESYEKNSYIGWNFDSSPNPDHPCVWVSSISVLALDQVVRMLDARINRTVLRHFETVILEKPHTDLPINELIFADYGFHEYFYKNHAEEHARLLPIPIQLELMRAHIMRACLPRFYSQNSDVKIYSSILYGPPGTGKTTLAEVLAYNSGQPLVKLSPSDLNVQGESLIEGRARDVFEALSMLTQAVIIFDEFEPIVQTRELEDIIVENEKLFAEEDDILTKSLTEFLATINQSLNSDPSRNAEFQQSIVEIAKSIAADAAASPSIHFDNTALRNIANELREIRRKDDPTLRFLLAGMLPKFLKLHDAAKEQSFVYFGGTNVMKDIDPAAKRPGRFDLKIPIYHPCPLSRAGTFLYRLSKHKDAPKELDLFNDREQMRRFLHVVLATVNEPASDLAQIYFNENRSNYITYVLTGNGTGPEISMADKKIAKMENELNNRSGKLEEIEKKEYRWLIGFEEHLREQIEQFEKSPNNEDLINILKKCLKYNP